MELTSKAMAGMLGISATVVEDLEGLLFGRSRMDGAVVIESCLLTGRAWSVCEPNALKLTQGALELVNERIVVGQRLLGWCSFRADRSPLVKLERLREKLMNAAVGAQVGTAPPGVLSCICLRNQCVGSKAIFTIDSRFGVGPMQMPVNVRVRSVGSTATVAAGSGDEEPPLMVSGPLSKIFEVIDEPRRRLTEAMESAAMQGLEHLAARCVADDGFGAELRQAQRAAFLLQPSTLSGGCALRERSRPWPTVPIPGGSLAEALVPYLQALAYSSHPRWKPSRILGAVFAGSML